MKCGFKVDEKLIKSEKAIENLIFLMNKKRIKKKNVIL